MSAGDPTAQAPRSGYLYRSQIWVTHEAGGLDEATRRARAIAVELEDRGEVVRTYVEGEPEFINRGELAPPLHPMAQHLPPRNAEGDR